MASAILITPEEDLAKATAAEIERQMQTLSRKDIIKESIENFGAIIVCENMAEAVDFANELAPEHLEVCCENPLEYIGKLDNAGFRVPRKLFSGAARRLLRGSKPRAAHQRHGAFLLAAFRR